MDIWLHSAFGARDDHDSDSGRNIRSTSAQRKSVPCNTATVEDSPLHTDQLNETSRKNTAAITAVQSQQIFFAVARCWRSAFYLKAGCSHTERTKSWSLCIPSR